MRARVKQEWEIMAIVIVINQCNVNVVCDCVCDKYTKDVIHFDYACTTGFTVDFVQSKCDAGDNDQGRCTCNKTIIRNTYKYTHIIYVEWVQLILCRTM